MLRKPQSALVIAGHGSTVNPDSSAPTHAHAREIRRRGCFGEVHTGFWKEEPSLRQVLCMVESDDVYIVPNFISEGYFTRIVIPRELELDGSLTVRADRHLKYCEPVGNHARMTELLLRRAAEVAPHVPRQETSLVIVGHGTSLSDNSAAAVSEQVEKIRAETDFAEVHRAYMEEPPFVADWMKFTRAPSVVVVPFFVSDGLHSYQDIPVLLGIESEPGEAVSQRQVFRRNPHRLHGRELYYANALGTEPGFADIILDQVRAFDQAHAFSAV